MYKGVLNQKSCSVSIFQKLLIQLGTNFPVTNSKISQFFFLDNEFLKINSFECKIYTFFFDQPFSTFVIFSVSGCFPEQTIINIILCRISSGVRRIHFICIKFKINFITASDSC